MLNQNGKTIVKIPSKKVKKQAKAIHLDVYTKELKILIGKLNDDTLDAVQATSKQKIKKNARNIDEGDAQ